MAEKQRASFRRAKDACEPIEEASISKSFESFDSDRWARTVADQTFQTFAIGAIQRNVCMKAESIAQRGLATASILSGSI